MGSTSQIHPLCLTVLVGVIVASVALAAEAGEDPAPSTTAPVPQAVAVPAMPTAARDAAARYLTAHLSSAERIYGHCRKADLPADDMKVEYAGRAIIRCDYVQQELPAVIYLMNPTTGNLADRVGHACNAIGQGDHAGCGEHLAQHILSQNGGQFVVAGQVIETRAEIHGGTDQTPVYEEFRDGVTISTKIHLTGRSRKANDQELADASGMKARWVGVWGRVPSGSWSDYEVARGHVQPGGTPSPRSAANWLEAVRENEFNAQDSGDDVLLKGVAMNREASLKNETLVCNEKCGSTPCGEVAKGMTARAQALMKCPATKSRKP